jgi:Copper transport outer membrane protein, MctB
MSGCSTGSTRAGIDVISLRQHAISLAAVFVALAVGVLLGSGFLSNTLLSGMRDESRNLHSQIDALNSQKDTLNQKLSSADTFDSQMAGRMVHDALNGRSVVIFRSPDAKDDDVDAVSKLVGQSGGAVTGTVTLTQEFVDANSAEKLRSVVNSSILPAGTQLSTKLVDQGSQAGDLLGIALLINRDPAVPTVDDAQRDTVLAALRDTGFIGYGNQHVGAANAAAVITGGGLGDDAGNQGVSVARFAAALAPHGSGVVLAGRDGSSGGVAAVAVARADASVTSAISTVDDLNAESGRITAVLGMADLANGGRTGQYGTGHGATGLTVAS